MQGARPESPWFLEVLACPDCQGPVSVSPPQDACAACGYRTERSAPPLDLRPQSPRPLQAQLPRTFDPTPSLVSVNMTPPQLTFEGPTALRDSRELFSALLEAGATGGNLLDLGCGPRDQAAPAEHLGFRYVGIDLFHEAADIRADAHALPFASESFDVVLSYAVLEHLHNPFLALSEVRRVLRPGGRFVGTVSQGEPFHNSYFHHTPWGLVSAAAFAGLQVMRLWPSRDTLRALSDMGHYSLPARWGLRALDMVERRLPFLTPRRWLRWTQMQKLWDGCVRGGSLCFILCRIS